MYVEPRKWTGCCHTKIDYPSTALASIYRPKNKKLRISEYIVLPSDRINSAKICLVSGDLYIFSFSVTISALKKSGSATNGSAVRTSVCLTLLNPSTFSSWQK